MANLTIFLVLTLSLGVSLALDGIENSRDKTAPNKWSFLKRIGSRKSEDSTKRNQLPNTVTTVQSDDYGDHFHSLCHEQHSHKPLENIWIGNKMFRPAQRYVPETRCSTNVDDSDVYMFEDKPHQICTVKESVTYFCQTLTEERTVVYWGFSPPFVQRRKETFNSGCGCVFASDL